MNSKALVPKLTAGLIGLLGVSCAKNSQDPLKTDVDKNIVVTVYSARDNGASIDTVPPCLLEESVHISELIHYQGGEEITMPFYFTDTAKWSKITEEQQDNRIVICIDGKIVYTPVVKMKIPDGACSVLLDSEQAGEMFPDLE